MCELRIEALKLSNEGPVIVTFRIGCNALEREPQGDGFLNYRISELDPQRVPEPALWSQEIAHG